MKIVSYDELQKMPSGTVFCGVIDYTGNLKHASYGPAYAIMKPKGEDAFDYVVPLMPVQEIDTEGVVGAGVDVELCFPRLRFQEIRQAFIHFYGVLSQEEVEQIAKFISLIQVERELQE